MVGPDRLTADRAQVSIDLGPADRLDVARFRALLTVVEEDQHGEDSLCAECVAALTEAAELYTAFSPLAAYLSKAAGTEVDVLLTKDYDSHIDHIMFR